MNPLILILVLTLISFLSCAGRLPPSKTATNVIDHHFHRYAKKYPASAIGSHRIEEVQILNIEEIHKHLVAVTCLVKLEGGTTLKTRSVLEKKTLRWKHVSWEAL